MAPPLWLVKFKETLDVSGVYGLVF